MENVRSSKKNEINISVVFFGEGKLICPKKITPDEFTHKMPSYGLEHTEDQGQKHCYQT